MFGISVLINEWVAAPKRKLERGGTRWLWVRPTGPLGRMNELHLWVLMSCGVAEEVASLGEGLLINSHRGGHATVQFITVDVDRDCLTEILQISLHSTFQKLENCSCLWDSSEGLLGCSVVENF